MFKKKNGFFLLIIFLFIFAGSFSLLFFHERQAEMASYINVTNKQQFIDNDTLKLTGNTDAKKVRISIDYDYQEKIRVKDGKFSYDLDISSYDKGWHYIEVYSDPKLAPYQTGEGIWINKLENQPSVVVPNELVQKARNSSKELYIDYRNKIIENYTWNGNYFNESVYAYRDVPFDEAGIPLYEWENEDGEKELAYHPVRTAQYALGAYNQYLEDSSAGSKEIFLKQAEWLIENQEKNGSFKYPFSFSYAGRSDMTMEAGWTSAMAQGQIMSVFARAYGLTNEEKYIAAGNAAFEYMLIETEGGG